jgi:hypothetical protein
MIRATLKGSLVLFVSMQICTGCRSAVIAEANDPHTQTVVTVEHRPTTSPSDPHLIIRDRE